MNRYALQVVMGSAGLVDVLLVLLIPIQGVRCYSKRRSHVPSDEPHIMQLEMDTFMYMSLHPRALV